MSCWTENPYGPSLKNRKDNTGAGQKNEKYSLAVSSVIRIIGLGWFSCNSVRHDMRAEDFFFEIKEPIIRRAVIGCGRVQFSYRARAASDCSERPTCFYCLEMETVAGFSISTASDSTVIFKNSRHALFYSPFPYPLPLASMCRRKGIQSPDLRETGQQIVGDTH